jgi:hypothetical protein
VTGPAAAPPARPGARAVLLAASVAATGCQPLSLDPFLYDPLPEPPGGYALSRAVIPAHEDLTIATPDGESLHAVFIPSSGRRPDVTLVYFHGQSHNIGTTWERLELLFPIGYNIVALDPRGYGRSTGTPTEAGIRTDLLALRSRLDGHPGIDPRRLVYYGRSLGGALAIELGARRAPAALVTESAFTSVEALAKDGTTLGLPRSFVARDRWDNLSKIRQLTAPFLALHGDADPYVQPRYSRELVAAHPGRHELVLVPGADHGDVPQRMEPDAYRQAVRDFVEREIGAP